MILGSSCATELIRAADSLTEGPPEVRKRPKREQEGTTAIAADGVSVESGASFVLDPRRLAAEPTLPLPARFGGAFLAGLDCDRLDGSLGLKGDALGVAVSTRMRLEDDPRATAFWNGLAEIDPAWLEAVPASAPWR